MTTDAPSPRNAMWKVLSAVAIIVVLITVALAILKNMAGKPRPPGAPATEVELKEGNPVPDFVLPRIGGGEVKLSEIPAKVVLVNFWATWCEACVVEMPSIVKLRQAYADRGFEVVAINVEENAETVVPGAARKFGFTFPSYADKDGKISDLFDVHGIPLTVILGPAPERRILLVETGERDWNKDDIRAMLERWLAQ